MQVDSEATVAKFKDSWTVADVLVWTQDAFEGRLEQQVSEFVLTNRITGQLLKSLGHAQLRGAGIHLAAHRNKVLMATKDLLGEPTGQPTAAVKQARSTPRKNTPRKNQPTVGRTTPRRRAAPKDSVPHWAGRRHKGRAKGFVGSPRFARTNVAARTPRNTPSAGRRHLKRDADAMSIDSTDSPRKTPRRSPRPCRYGERCNRRDCKFGHITGLNRSGLQQKKAEACKPAAGAPDFGLPEWNIPANIPASIVKPRDNHPVNVFRRQFQLYKMADQGGIGAPENTVEIYGSEETVRWVRVEGSMSPHGDLFYTGRQSIDTPQELEEMKKLAIECGAVAFTESGWFKHTLWPVRNWVSVDARGSKIQLGLHKREWTQAKLTCWVRETEANRWDRNKFWGKGLDAGTQIESVATMMEGTSNEAVVLSYVLALCNQGRLAELLRWRCWNKGGTLLHVAAGRGHCRIIEYLLSQGFRCFINHQRQGVKASDGCTPLHCASWHSQKAAMELLRKHGAKDDIKNNYGELPVHFQNLFPGKHKPQKSALPSLCKAFRKGIQISSGVAGKDKVQEQMERFRRNKNRSKNGGGRSRTSRRKA